jgi:hypothetical protein
MKKAATPKRSSLTLHTDESKATRPPFKLEETLICLLQRGVTGLTEPEAHAIYGESCLHTVISMFQNKHGIQIMRKQEPKHNKYRMPYTRYWLADGKAEILAVCLLNVSRFKRAMEPIIPSCYDSLRNRAA